jgi:hypothetical protein
MRSCLEGRKEGREEGREEGEDCTENISLAQREEKGLDRLQHSSTYS